MVLHKAPSASIKCVVFTFLIGLFLSFSTSIVFARSLGDVNNDGTLDVRDVVLVMRSILELEELNMDQRVSADVNGDGLVDIKDLTLLMRKVLGLVSTTVNINVYEDIPESINKPDTIFVEGLTEDNYIEVVVDGKVIDFETAVVDYNLDTSSFEEIEIIHREDILENQIVIIEAAVPCGMPYKKLKWKSVSGVKYETYIVEDGVGNRIWTFFVD